jgi:hypothetical protein
MIWNDYLSAACKVCSGNEECGKSEVEGLFKCIPKENVVPSSSG